MIQPTVVSDDYNFTPYKEGAKDFFCINRDHYTHLDSNNIWSVCLYDSYCRVDLIVRKYENDEANTYYVKGGFMTKTEFIEHLIDNYPDHLLWFVFNL